MSMRSHWGPWHYASDNNGHALATNRAVGLLYPKLAAKYGPVVPYAYNPKAHIVVEFGFDVLQVAQGRYMSEGYHDFIGFQVSKPVLERAFQNTYGLTLQDLFTDVDGALGTYRYMVSTLIPKMTRVAWETKKKEIEKLTPGMTHKQFIYRFPRAQYEKEFGTGYKRPGYFDKTLAFLFRLIPKVGPLRALAFKPPTDKTERLFIESFNATLKAYTALLDQVRDGALNLPNRNFDTGEPTRAGEYELTDRSYARLLDKLVNGPSDRIPPELRANILTFYQNGNAPVTTRQKKDRWQKTLMALQKLKATTPAALQPTSK